MSKVHPQEVQTALIQIFQQWGMPKSVRVDNGMPLGDPQRKSIPELALWLTAIGIEVFFNRPRRPTDNAKVERMQRTTKNWACIEQAKDYQDLAQRLQYVGLIQREHFKVSRLENKTRMQAFPDLTNNLRKYDPDNFQVHKAYQRLANTPHELKELLREMIREEFQDINKEMQRVIGEDDLVSTGTAGRLLGVCSKQLRYMINEGHFTVFHHLKERRFIRAELLEFRNRKKVDRLKRS